MMAFNHVLAGSIIAVIVPAPLVPIVALLSHYLLDLSPHSLVDEKWPYSKAFQRVIALDALLSIAGVTYAIVLFPQHWLIIVIGALFGYLPDFLWPFEGRGPKWFNQFLEWSNWIQWGERSYGWIFEAFYGLMAVITLHLLSQ